MPVCNSCGTVLLSDAQLAAVVRRRFGDLPIGTQRIAMAVALAESCGGHADAWNCTGEDSRGLWQINVAAGANTDLLALGNLFDPDVNARAARIVHDRNSGWCPWAVYEEWCGPGHTGSYRNYLPRAVAALPEAEPPPPPVPRPIPNGLLVTYAGSGGRVWIISGGRRREIISIITPGDVFLACRYDFALVRSFTRERVLAMPEGDPVTGPPDCPYGGRVRLAPIPSSAVGVGALIVLGGGLLIAYGSRRRAVL